MSNNSFAQGCIFFEDISNGTIYGPPNYNVGDALFSSGNVSATLTSFTDANETEILINTQIQTLNQGDLSGNTLFLNNAGVRFDYSAVIGTLASVNIDFAYYGGAINVRINGQDLLLLDQLEQGSYQPTPQNQMFVFFDDDVNGRMAFNGPIESLEIAGQEIYLDNPCYLLMTDCEFTDVFAEAHPCEGNSFLLDVDFDYANIGSSDVYISMGGQTFGPLNLDQNFFTVGPFLGGQDYTLVVFAVGGSANNCATIYYDVPTPECGIAGNCEIGVPSLTNLECDGTFFYGTLDFDYANVSDSFNLYISNLGDTYTETIAYADIPISVGPINADVVNTFGLSVYDAVNNNTCGNGIEFPGPDCENTDCTFADLVIETHDCDAIGTFLIDLDFNYSNTSDSFDIYINGGGPEDYYATYAYTDLYITFGPFDAIGEFLEILIIDQENSNCWQVIPLEVPNCGTTCEVSGLQASVPVCNANGTYDLNINFDYENPENGFFDIFNENNDLIGSYALADLPITLTNYTPAFNSTETFQICINDNPNCCSNLLTIDFPDCNDECNFSGLVVEAYDCDNNGNFLVDLDFNYSNTSDSFDIYINGDGPEDYYATYAYADLYVTIGPFESIGSFLEIFIVDQEFSSCWQVASIETPDCNLDCTITPPTVEAFDCDDEGNILVELNISAYANTSDSFDVVGDDNYYGTFAFADLPVIIGPVVGDGSFYNFITKDSEEIFCGSEIIWQSPICDEFAVSCIDFEGLTNGINYGGSYSNPGDLLLIENDVLVTMEGVPDPLGNLNYDYLFATTQDICSPFNAAAGNRLFMFNGVRFDFSQLAQYPTEVSFPYFDCGVPFAITANGQTPVTYLAPTENTTFNLTPTVTISISLNANDPEEGYITLTGDQIETFFIGGVELQIDNVCFNVLTENPEVWPGDCNYDNTANNFDLLNLGIAYGSEGPERNMSNTDWAAMPAENWMGFFSDGETNYKHADSDGNGEINEDDLSTILDNYDLNHGEVPIFIPMPSTPEDPPFFVNIPDADQIEVGVPFEAPILLGSAAIPVDEIYGIAFTLEFDIDMFDESSVSIELNNGWLGANGGNIITLNKSFANEGRFEIALSRTDQENIEGHGSIGYFIGIIDDILGRTEVQVTVNRVKAITKTERPVPLFQHLKIVDLATNTNDLDQGQIDIFPNPTSEEINIVNHSEQIINNIKVYNTLGQLMATIHAPEAVASINAETWASGIYFVIVEGEVNTFTQKIEKVNK